MLILCNILLLHINFIMDPSGLRNFKDFLQLYNQMTERCFYKCIENTNSRQLSPSEIECADKCATKFIRFNNKLMINFVRRQSDLVNRRMKEAEEMMKNQEAASNQQVSVSSS